MHILTVLMLSTIGWTNPVTDTTATNSDIQLDSEVQLECKIESDLIDTLIANGKQLLGTPYKYGGTTKKGIDCSALVQYIFGSMGADVARTSRSLATLGYEIDEEQVKKGDLVFFKGRNINSNSIGHVAYVVGGEGKNMILLHATSRGVILDEMSDMSYYQKRFLFAKRVAYDELFELF